jgi:hypothetical protein
MFLPPINFFSFDFLEVREGGAPDAPLVGRFCGQSLPSSYASSGNQVCRVARFVSVQHTKTGKIMPNGTKYTSSGNLITKYSQTVIFGMQIPTYTIW